MSAGMTYLLIFLIPYLLIRAGLAGIFSKAGFSAWKALVPFYGEWVWLKLAGRQSIFLYILILFPLTSPLMLIILSMDSARVLGEHRWWLLILTGVFPFLMLPFLGIDPWHKVAETGPDPESHGNPAGGKEWVITVFYAFSVVFFIRIFLIETYLIPSSSMESTLMVGDVVAVSKIHYGLRMPRIPLAFPLVHNHFETEEYVMPSYSGKIELPYFRLPAITPVRRNDIIVFNYPAHDIHDIGYGLVKEVNMKENYIKRCVGLPGDTLKISGGQLFVNGDSAWVPPAAQLQYLVRTNGSEFDPDTLRKLGFRYPPELQANFNYFPISGQSGLYYFWMTEAVANSLRTFPEVVDIDKLIISKDRPGEDIFPNDLADYPWNRDFFGPVPIPAKGETVLLSTENYKLYERIITAYEGHQLDRVGESLFIDGVERDRYTFAMDYFFVMGDNRDDSEDSRFWGFVPEDHIVGKPLCVMFSFEQNFGFRWDRIGTAPFRH
jgi:signal peptidase I